VHGEEQLINPLASVLVIFNDNVPDIGRITEYNQTFVSYLTDDGGMCHAPWTSIRKIIDIDAPIEEAFGGGGGGNDDDDDDDDDPTPDGYTSMHLEVTNDDVL
jgi:hypothetical protein